MLTLRELVLIGVIYFVTALLAIVLTIWDYFLERRCERS